MSPVSIDDDHTLGLIVSRVVIALRDELEAIVVELGRTSVGEPVLTVDDVAERLGVARSTVYAHWREWGGYKLGGGEKAAIRFSASALPTRSAQDPRNGSASKTTSHRSRSRRRPLLRAAPRLPVSLGDDG
jgi:hypothetical protein